MKIESIKFGLAAAITTAILWSICSALVALLPGEMASMSAHMMHVETDHFGWMLSFYGFAVGLVAWSATAFVSAWLLARIYNAQI